MKLCGLILVILSGSLFAQVPTFNHVTDGPNSKGAQSGFSTTPDYQVPVAESVSAGDTLVAGLCYNGSTPTVTASDSASDAPTLLVSSAVSGNGNQCRLYSFTASGTVSWINFHFSSTSETFVQILGPIDFFNVAAVSPKDAAVCNIATSATITSGSLGTLAASGDEIIQIIYNDSHASQTNHFTAGSQANITWQLALELLGDGGAIQYGVYNSTVALNPTFTQASSAAFISCAVALKAGTSGAASNTVPYSPHVTMDAMPQNATNPWPIGAIVTSNTVVFTYTGNDAISAISSTPSPDVVNWTASGADFVGLNGHNHVNVYCAQFSTPPGSLKLSLTRVGAPPGNDSINMIYDVQGGSCNLDQDSGGQAGNQSAFTVGTTATFNVCAGCVTPAHVNDFIVTLGGQQFCTVENMTSPAGALNHSVWFSGNGVDGPSQTGENNGFGHFRNGASLSAPTVTWFDVCSSVNNTPPGNWANRVVAYQSTSPLIGSSAQNGVRFSNGALLQ